jgi:hypothetical protein
MIYLYCLKQDDSIKYIGLTNNPKTRQAQHARKKPSPHSFHVLESFDDVAVASRREVELIEQHNTTLTGWNISPGGDYEGASGYERKGIGGVPKGTSTWNKGKHGCFSEETIRRFREVRKGRIHSSKVTPQLVSEIRKRFKEHPPIDCVGSTGPNGRLLTQERAFSNLYFADYGLTNINLYNIVSGKSWKNIN